MPEISRFLGIIISMNFRLIFDEKFWSAAGKFSQNGFELSDVCNIDAPNAGPS